MADAAASKAAGATHVGSTPTFPTNVSNVTLAYGLTFLGRMLRCIVLPLLFAEAPAPRLLRASGTDTPASGPNPVVEPVSFPLHNP